MLLSAAAAAAAAVGTVAAARLQAVMKPVSELAIAAALVLRPFEHLLPDLLATMRMLVLAAAASFLEGTVAVVLCLNPSMSVRAAAAAVEATKPMERLAIHRSWGPQIQTG